MGGWVLGIRCQGIVNLTFVVTFVSICQGQTMSVSYKYHRFPIEVIRVVVN